MMKQKQSNVLYVYIYRYIYVKYIHSHDLMQNSIGGGGATKHQWLKVGTHYYHII